MRHANVSVFVPHSGCPNTCSFCNQRAISGTVSIPDANYVAQLCENAIPHISDGKNSEIAFFGGSFTAIERELMLSLLKAAYPFVKMGYFSGIRISTRPDCIDKEVLSILKEYGVRAIELGAQSMNDQVLIKNLRGHTASDTVRASQLIRDNGFELGLQMMVGLPGDTASGAVDTAKKLAELKPDTARIYPTMVIKDTLLHRMYESGEYIPMTLNETVDCCCDILDVFDSAGIRVIRLGLHSEESLNAQLVAGAYHPAFGELCYGRQYLKKAAALLKDIPKGDVIIYVHPSCVSKMTGQRSCNIKEIKKLGFNAHILPDPSLKQGEVRVSER